MTVGRSSAPSLPRFPHAAYIEALAQADEGSTDWGLLTAGLAALQLFESWAENNCGTVPLGQLELRRVSRWIEAVPDVHPVRRCLSQLVDAVERSDGRGRRDRSGSPGVEIGRVLAAYAKLLQYDGRWQLAADVHRTLIDHARCLGDEERVLDSRLMVGFSHRMLGRFAEAQEAYAALREAAVRVGDEHYRRQADLGFAKLAIERGNLPLAGQLLDRIVDEARGADRVVLAKALSDRARVVVLVADYPTALTFGYEALSNSKDAMDRDRVMIDIAVTFANMGLRDQARDANLIAFGTAQESAIRSAAQINLMELAYLDRNEIAFEQHRREVSNVELPPYLGAAFCETLALGYRVFDRVSESRDAFQRMLRIAEQHGLNEYAVKAATALEEPPSMPSRSVSPVGSEVLTRSPEVAAIARAISDLRLEAMTRE